MGVIERGRRGPATRFWVTISLGLALGLTASCGTRVTRDAENSAARAASRPADPTARVTSQEGPTGSTPASAGEITTGPAPGTVATRGGMSTNASGADTSAAAPTTLAGGSAGQRGNKVPPADAAAGRLGRTEDPSKVVPGSAGPGAPTPGTVGPGPNTSSLVPVAVGNIGHYSGPGSSSIASARPTLGAWARLVNERGGLKGRQVKVWAADDAGDPARSQAIVKDLVENHKVVAFVGNINPLTIQASRVYLEQKRIPVVGGGVTENDWNQSLVFFPQGTSWNHLAGSVAKASIAEGKTRIAQLMCVESPTCVNSGSSVKKAAQRYGGQVVYEARVSVTQPDYTAECLQAKNAEAQAMVIWAEANTYRRTAASCARQGFRPTFVIAGVIVTGQLNEDPNFEGMLAVQSVFPWISSSSPSTAEFQEAMKRFGPSVELGGTASAEWAAGKLLEKAVAKAADVTSQSILEGLWTLKDETLSGLTPPLTFVANQPAPETRCFFAMKVVREQWTLPHGDQLDCVD